MRLFIALLLISFQAFAIEWSELEHGETYTLKQSFQLKIEVERSGSILDVVAGQKVRYAGYTPLNIPGFPMILYHFQYRDCPGMQMTTEVDIVEAIQPNGKVVNVGAQLDRFCILQFYVEGYDWKTESLFE